MKKILIILILGLILLNGCGLVEINKRSKEEKNSNYQIVLSRIEKGNSWIIDNGWSDDCDSYRYFHRGCYYRQLPGLERDAIIGGRLEHYNLTREEILELCKKFIFQPHVTFCLSRNAENKEECLNFAGDDEYLIRLCNLEDWELIPSKKYGPYPGDTVYKVDSWETIEPQQYPYL